MLGQPRNVAPPLLRRIEAKNVLSFGPDGIDLELPALTVLIGPNGSGKSNLFEIIRLMSAAPGDLVETIRTGGGDQRLDMEGKSKVVRDVRRVAIVENPGQLISH